MSRGILATCSAPLTPGVDRDDVAAAYVKAYDDEPFVHLLPEGQWPQTKAVLGANAVHLQVAVDERAGRLVAVARDRQPHQGHRRRRVQCMNLALGLDETTGLTTRREWRRERHPPAGLPRPPASPRASSRPGGQDVALVVNDGPGVRAAAVFTANRCKANPVLWSEQVVKDGVVRAVVLNSGGANCYTGPEGFQTTHAVAERVAEHLGLGAIDVVVCSTGLIGLANDATSCSPASTRRTPRWPRDGGRRRRRTRS